MEQKTENRKQKTILEVKPFRVEHLDGVDVAAMTEGRHLAFEPGAVQQEAWRRAERGVAFSGFWAGRLMGMAGLYATGPGTAEGWVLLTPEVQALPVAAVRMIRRGLEILMRSMKLKQVATLVRGNWPAARKFAKVLGFRQTEEPPYPGPDGTEYLPYVRRG